MKIVPWVAGAAVALTAAPCAAATPVDYNFSFSGSDGSTVTGIIQGLMSDVSTPQTATHILVTSGPNVTSPVDVTTWDGSYPFHNNSFTIVSGNIDPSVSYASYVNGYSPGPFGQLYINAGGYQPDAIFGYATSGFSHYKGVTSTGPATFSRVSAVAAVPELATWAMMLGGFGFVGSVMRFRRRKPQIFQATA